MDVDRLLSGILSGSPARGALPAGLLGGLVGGMLGRRRGMRLGGLALLGGLAWMAWRRFSEKTEGEVVPAGPSGPGPRATVVTGSADAPRVAGRELAAPPPESGFVPAGPAERQALGLLLVRAMIAAAKADGELDFDESTRIFGKVSELGLGAEERAVLERELSAPLDVAAVADAATTPEARAEVYTASVLVVAARNDAEREYLEDLRERLGLDPRLAREIEAEVGEAG